MTVHVNPAAHGSNAWVWHTLSKNCWVLRRTPLFQNLDDGSIFAANSARARELEASVQTWKAREQAVRTQRSFVLDDAFNVWPEKAGKNSQDVLQQPTNMA